MHEEIKNCSYPYFAEIVIRNQILGRPVQVELKLECCLWDGLWPLVVHSMLRIPVVWFSMHSRTGVINLVLGREARGEFGPQPRFTFYVLLGQAVSEGIPPHRPRSRHRCLCWGLHCTSLPSGWDAKTITKSSASWKTRKLESKPRPMPKFGNVKAPHTNEKRLSHATKLSKGTHFSLCDNWEGTCQVPFSQDGGSVAR